MIRYFLLLFLSCYLQTALALDKQAPITIDAKESDTGFIVQLQIPQGWYVYSNKTGDSGLPLEIKVQNLKFSDYIVQWPEPIRDVEKIKDIELVNYIYRDSVTIPVHIKNFAHEELDVKVTLGACEKYCIAQSKTFKLGSAFSQKALSNWVVMIALAFLGGLILNIMPCVLPVLALKLMNIVKYSGHSHSQIRLSLFTTSFGIIFSFWIIALFTIGLKELGQQFGWGFQFQNPFFILFLIGVLGIYLYVLVSDKDPHLPRWLASKLSKDNKGLLGSFLTGAFATLLATPCTAPFISTTVAFALTGSSIKILVIYTAMGLGMSFPYYLVGINQKLLKSLPKPGKWMSKVKKVFAILILFTIMWLISVFTSQYYVKENLNLETGMWEQFSEEKLNHYIAKDELVLVDVTASWCLICQFNKTLVLTQNDILEFLQENNVKTLRADFTTRSEEISKYIKLHNRYGIPLNVVYGPNAKTGIVLPELLTKDSVKKAITRASKNYN